MLRRFGVRRSRLLVFAFFVLFLGIGVARRTAGVGIVGGRGGRRGARIARVTGAGGVTRLVSGHALILVLVLTLLGLTLILRGSGATLSRRRARRAARRSETRLRGRA